MPVHITSGIAGSAARFAGSAASDTRSKWKAISGAVARLAATVKAAPMRSGSGSPRSTPASGRASTKIPATAAKLSCQPTSCHARGSKPSVTVAASRSAYHRDAGRPANAATTPAKPITPARMTEGPAPVTGTYTAINIAMPISRPRLRSPAAASSGQASAASSATFCPLTASTCASPESLKS